MKLITTDEGETTQDEDSDDESYGPTSDSFDDSEEEIFDKDWRKSSAWYKASCILVMYCNTCHVCFQPVKYAKYSKKVRK